MLSFFYFFLRGAIGFSIIVSGLAVLVAHPWERGLSSFGSLYIAAGCLFCLSALDPEVHLQIDLDNLIFQSLMYVLGLSLLDMVLYLFGSERQKGARKLLVRAGLAFELALVLLPLLDYALGLGAHTVNVEDSLVRGPIHEAAIVAGYAWPLLSTSIAIAIARWKPTDIKGSHPETHRLVVFFWGVLPLVAVILLALVLSLKAVYRVGHIVLELALVGWYLQIAHAPRTLMHLREEIGVEHAVRLRLTPNEIALITERLARVVAGQQDTILDESFDLKKLASLIGVPAYRLSSFFNSTLKTSFPAWRNSYRIDFACALMAKRPDLSLIDVSAEAGYRSKASFNEQFQRIIGMSPSEYRRRLVKPTGESGGS